MHAEAALAAAEPYLTPLAVADRAVLEANLARMAALAAGAGLRLRPHAKTHKSAWVAQRQMAHGAVGITAATLVEAEAFAAAGVEDILVAHPPAGEAKLRRLAALARRVPRLAVALDSVELALQLPSAVEVMWEVDTGLHRVGTAPGAPTAEAVVDLVRALPGDRFRGLLTHAGQAYQGDRAGAAREEWSGLAESAAELRSRGVEVRVLSVGSTPTAAFAPEAAAGGTTEMRPGTYVYGDANQVALGSQSLEECALGVVATVVSTPGPDRRVLDAGSKALSADLRVPGLNGFGIVLGHPELVVERLNEEHAVVTGPADLRVGDRVVVIPAHVCTAVNLHPAVLFYGDGEAGWDPVVARGWQPA
ncbi:MAG TPA: alanine racemase [Candidatus Dormibacteraeota bacterium]